jgi:hypothetical protein
MTLACAVLQRAAVSQDVSQGVEPVATGRCGCRHHSLQLPGYTRGPLAPARLAVVKAKCRAQAVTPLPQ